MADQIVPGRLSGQAAVVTGGGSGFGAGIVRRFVAEIEEKTVQGQADDQGDKSASNDENAHGGSPFPGR